MQIVESKEPDASCWPSGEQAREQTVAEWLVHVASSAVHLLSPPTITLTARCLTEVCDKNVYNDDSRGISGHIEVYN